MSTGRGISVNSGGGGKVIPLPEGSFVAADLDVDGNFSIDMTAFNASTIRAVEVTDENERSMSFTYSFIANILKLELFALGFSGTWHYNISYTI